MPIAVGVDDTDSRTGMCTTYVATEILAALPDLDVIGYPRLVRLNPAIPWKTRGNGAIALRLGHGEGPGRQIGEVNGRPVWAYGRGNGADMGAVADVVSDVVAQWACLEDDTTHPGFAVLAGRPRPGLYWRAVRGVVTRREARRAYRGEGTIRGLKKGRGIIGSLAALAWRPRDRTYEVLAYRASDRWGTPRLLDPLSVRALDAFPSTFHNYDYANDQPIVAPHSPCPVLFGVRGDVPQDLVAAKDVVQGEPYDRWLLFETNQATDDHLLRNALPAPHTSVVLDGTVARAPRTRPGGHVVFPLAGRSPVDCVAYEPTKQFRRLVRALRPGDRVRVFGEVRREPRSINLEKLALLACAPNPVKVANPLCRPCGKRMKSRGAFAGYRCVRCGRRAPERAATFAERPRDLWPGVFEPPVVARRHLAKPLKRMGRPVGGIHRA
jgi:tRNA(Ile2)-agmatinylcytidine synthase